LHAAQECQKLKAAATERQSAAAAGAAEALERLLDAEAALRSSHVMSQK